MNTRYLQNLFLILFLTLAGCSNLWNPPTTSPGYEPTADARASINPPAAGKRTLDSSLTTDLYWQVPGESVETYHIYYGLSPNDLNQHIDVKTVDLEKFPSAEYGAVFRYKMPVPRGQTIYLKIISENRLGRSGDSQLIKIANGKQEAVKR